MKKTILRSRAFTLIELIVVIAIIGLLTGIIMTNFGPSRGKARDTKRISDLSHLQLALELYFDRCRQYPPSINDTTVTSSTCPPSITLGSYISVIPAAPASGTYDYAVHDSSGSLIDYVLHSKLESYNEIIRDGLPSGSGTGSDWSVTTGSSFSCTNASPGTDYCVGPK